MKKIFILTVCVALLTQACKKTESTYRPLSSYTVVNAITDIASAKVYASENNISWKTLPATDVVAAYRSAAFGAYAGNNIIRAVSCVNTNKTIFSSSKPEEFKPAAFNTLFLCGDSVSGYDGIFLNNDNIIHLTDSVLDIRFINLSASSAPVNIALSTTPTANEATGLGCKQITEFKPYPALSRTADMVFELRDAGDVLITSYTLKQTRVNPYNSRRSLCKI
jgi:hypothetical protein